MTLPLLPPGHLLLLTAAWDSVLMPSQLTIPPNASSLMITPEFKLLLEPTQCAGRQQ
jgi:hypothetical protein